MVPVMDQAAEGQRVGGGAPRSNVERARARWGSVAIVVGVAVWLTVGLVGVAEQTMTGAAWVRVPLFVVAMVVLAVFAVLAVRSPRPVVTPGPAEVRGGYGVDGPEQRRVRRALRDGTPLGPGDRDRALAQANRGLLRTSRGMPSARDRYVNVAVVAYLMVMGLRSSPSLTAPTFESSDLWTLAAFGAAGVVVAALGWLPGRLGVPGRRWREDRLRRRIEVLESHPVAS